MDLLAHARIVLWEGGSLWLAKTISEGRSRTEPHAHHAIQVTLALDGEIRFIAGDLDVRGEAIAVATDTPHVFEASGLMAHLFVEPESRSGRIISRSLLDAAPLAVVPPALLGGLPERISAGFNDPERDDADLIEFGRALVGQLTGGAVGDAPDLRVRKMIALAREKLDGPVGLTDVAGIGGLSASRLRHLFVEQTGLQFRTYLLWLRLTRALESVAAGEPLTRAAHDAGFADSAHFSRTFRRMFGIVPTSLHMT
jgi:AraC family transcriptional regulator